MTDKLRLQLDVSQDQADFLKFFVDCAEFPISRIDGKAVDQLAADVKTAIDSAKRLQGCQPTMQDYMALCAKLYVMAMNHEMGGNIPGRYIEALHLAKSGEPFAHRLEAL